MSLEDLHSDYQSNLASAKSLLAQDPDNPLLKHLVNSVWPFQEAMLEEIAEQAEELDKVVDEAGDMLQPETAAPIAALIVLSLKVADELDKRLMPSDLELRGVLVELRKQAAESSAILDEVTVPPDSLDDDTVDAEGDDDDDDDDED